VIKIAKSGLLGADLTKGVNLFVGAGFSTLAHNSFGKPLPVGSGLKDQLVEKFELQAYSSLDLSSLYAVILADRRNELRSFLEGVFTVSTYDPRYDSIRKLSVEFLYTTNIDDLPFHIFSARAGEFGRVLHDIYLYGAPRNSSDVVQYIALHGSVRHEDADFLFTAGQISTAFASDRETWYVFQRELQARPTLFLGYGMRDAGVLQGLHDGSPKSNFNRWILLRSDDKAAEALYTSLGFHVIVGSIDEFLDFLDTQNLEPAYARPTIHNARRTGQVPSAAEVAQRPIRSFFLGAEPEWSDAYSNQVVRRRANSAVKNSLFSGKHVALVGLPLSGKTTILKQVASEIATERLALYFDRVSDPLADKIISENIGENNNPIIFIDNLIDSRDAIERLVKEIGAQIVCAEQSVYFDSVSLRAMSGNLDVHSSSDLSGQELQGIIDSIPADVRRWQTDALDSIEFDAGEIGLFEAFRRHVFDENLTIRFRAKLAEFERRDRAAFDVYIMACYVAACRSIVSFDMIYMFIEDGKKQYKDVYDIIERINSFLIEVELSDDPHQDYFSVRSGALARVALKECQPSAFGRVFDRFHSAVPMRVVVDYPVFRRYAYDNDFSRRAYPKVEDGLRFYKRLVKATDNAYDYQHGAIYLSKMGSYKEAFSWIDTAMSKSHGRVYSIRNTHARILFEANIDVVKQNPKKQTALEGIRESMSVLETCIEKDHRRSYHLLRFSDQALQYYYLFDSQESLRWLIHSRDRLSEMVDQAKISRSRESYNLRKYRKIFGEVKAALISRGADQ
jgi:hypothetical protein